MVACKLVICFSSARRSKSRVASLSHSWRLRCRQKCSLQAYKLQTARLQFVIYKLAASLFAHVRSCAKIFAQNFPRLATQVLARARCFHWNSGVVKGHNVGHCGFLKFYFFKKFKIKLKESNLSLW